MSFKSPQKWTILMLGSSFGIKQLNELPKSFFTETNLLVLLLAQLNEEDEIEVNRVKSSINQKSGQSGIIYVKIPRFEGICPASIDSEIDKAFSRI